MRFFFVVVAVVLNDFRFRFTGKVVVSHYVLLFCINSKM